MGLQEDVEEYEETVDDMVEEVEKIVVGNEDLIRKMLIALLSNGHIMLEGPSGTGKTILIRSLDQVVEQSEFNRVQFTVDLLPSDITGTEVYRKQTDTFEIDKGPVFTNFLLADEINRSPPKVQSALLQSMEEREVTIGGTTLQLPKPFLTMATINPQEEQGTFALPEAQVDRFLFKLTSGFLDRGKEKDVMEENLEVKDFDYFGLETVTSMEEIQQMQEAVKEIELPEEVKEYSVKMVTKTRNTEEANFDNHEYVQWGGSPRATISLNIAARANALMDGRTTVEIGDVQDVALPVLRHRVILNYSGKTQGIDKDETIQSLIKSVPTLV